MFGEGSGEVRLEVANGIAEVAEVYEMLGRTGVALQLFRRARRALEKLPGQHLSLAGTLGVEGESKGV